MNFSKFKPMVLLKYVLLAVLAVSFISACGYEDMNEEIAKYYTDDAKPRSALIEAETLKSYIDAGYTTPDGNKVLILYVTPQNGTLPTTTIKGAYAFNQEDYFMESRSDGPVVNGAMVASGKKIDGFLREFGIDENTLVVLTSSGHENQMLARAFWVLKYWGFSNKQVKILNGADKYFGTHNKTYMTALRKDMPVPSTYSVKYLPGKRMDVYRATIGEVLGYAKNNQLKADGTGAAIVIPTINPSGEVKANNKIVTYVSGNSNNFDGRIKGATQLAMKYNSGSPITGIDNSWNQYIATDGKYKTDKEILELMNGLVDGKMKVGKFLPTNDKSKRIITHCVTGRTTAPHWFVIKEILGYSNAAIYDGSYQEWTSLTKFEPAKKTDVFVNQKDTPKPAKPSEIEKKPKATEYLTWNEGKRAFTISSNKGDASVVYNAKMQNDAWDTSKHSEYVTMTDTPNTFTYNNDYAGEGRDINQQDMDYQAGKGDGSNGGNNGGGNNGGGNVPGGC